MPAERKTQRGRKRSETSKGSALDVAELIGGLPPSNLEAEKSVIASVLLMNEAFDEVADVINSRMFYADTHRKIWECIADMIVAGTPVDTVTLAQELENRGEFEEIGAGYLLQALETVPHAGHAKYYAEIVAELYIARSLVDSCTDIIRDVHRESELGRGGDMRAILSAAESRVFSIVERNAKRNSAESFGDVLNEVFSRLTDRMSQEGKMPGLLTGLNGLDKLTCGFEGGQFVVIGARPGVGKTSLVGNWAVKCSEAGGVLFFTLEMSRLELTERIICGQAEVNHYNFRQGIIDDDDQRRLSEASDRLRDVPIYIHDDRGIDVGEMMAVARRVGRRVPLAMVIIDYLQLIEGPRFTSRDTSREQIVAQISRRLKIMAGEINVPVVCLSQLNRDVERRENKRPRLSDLRESGAVEQDADIIIFLDRPEAYDPADRPGEADLVVAKNRSGPTGEVPLRFIKDQFRFVDKIEGAIDHQKLPVF